MSMKNAHACAIYLGEASPIFVAICTQRLRAFRRFFVKSCSRSQKANSPLKNFSKTLKTVRYIKIFKSIIFYFSVSNSVLYKYLCKFMYNTLKFML